MPMKIVIPGGSGQVGTILARAFHRDGHEVVVLSRQSASRGRGASSAGTARRSAAGDGDRRRDVVINLAGRSVNCRYTAANRTRDSGVARRSRRASSARRSPRRARPPASGCRPAPRRSTRIATTRRTTKRPALSAATNRTRRSTWRFSIDVARAWERAFDEAVDAAHAQGRASVGDDDEPGRRRRLRHAARPGAPRPRRPRRRRPAVRVVDSRRGLRPGGSLADRSRRIDGVVNVAAPNPLPNAEFMRMLREAAGVRVGLPATRWMLEIGASSCGPKPS